MGYKTKVDLSNNRQVNQRERSELILPGVTRFGLVAEELAVGPDLTTTRVLIPSVDNIQSTFVGNTISGVYTWSFGVADMAEGEDLIVNYDLTNQEGEIQNIGPVWIGKDPVLVDGIEIFTRYEAILYDLTLVEIFDTSGDVDGVAGDVSGSTRSTFEKLESDALDYNGDYIWVDVRGLIKTDNILITKVGTGPSTIDLGADAEGKVVNVASDIRLKENIEPIQGALDKVLGLNGVTFNWRDRKAGGDDLKLGFIAQDVQKTVPELVYTASADGYLSVYYKDAVPLIIEAIKELVNTMNTPTQVTQETTTETNVKEMNVEVIYSEDNNIELNFGGTHETSKGGGITVIDGVGDGENASITIDENGDWVISPNLVVKQYTPTSTEDEFGNPGNFTYDDDYLYIRTKSGWKRTGLENF